MSSTARENTFVTLANLILRRREEVIYQGALAYMAGPIVSQREEVPLTGANLILRRREDEINPAQTTPTKRAVMYGKLGLVKKRLRNKQIIVSFK